MLNTQDNLEQLYKILPKELKDDPRKSFFTGIYIGAKSTEPLSLIVKLIHKYFLIDDFANDIECFEYAIRQVGKCGEECAFYDNDGENGDIQICNHSIVDNDFPIEILQSCEICPFWTSSFKYCRQHKEIYSDKSKCSECVKEMVKQNGSK